MTYLKILFDFYINTSIHAALAVYALTRITEIYFDIPPNENLNCFTFYGTIIGYNFTKYAGVTKGYHMSPVKRLRLVQIFSFICFCLLCYYGSLLSAKILVSFIPFALITFLYAVPFLGGLQKSLRGINYLKIFVVAVVWSGVTAVIPLLAGRRALEVEMLLLFTQRLLFIVVLILPFEIRDLRLDLGDVKTLPQKVGVEQTKRFGFGILLLILILEFLIIDSNVLRNVTMGVCLVLLFFLMRSRQEQSKYYSSFWVESLPIFWWCILLIFF